MPDSDLLLSNEPAIRLGIFLGVLVAMAIWEVAAPRRRIEIPRVIRWTNNLGVVVVDTILVRLVYPIAAVGLALWAQAEGWGLFNLVDLPTWLEVLLAIILFDLIIYFQHVVFHHVPFLWRLHRMHHADTGIDVTTGLRFHPLEILISMALKFAAVLLLGPAAIAVLIFEVLLNATAMFNHSNVRIPGPVDKLLRLIVVTPDMHRVHHSIDRKETDSNYGFNLPWWDRLFGTYTAQPAKGHDGMTIGFVRFRSRRDHWLDRMLIQPFLGPANGPGPKEDGN